MRFVWAVVAFVLATLMIGAGIAQRTIFMGPDTRSESLVIEQSAPYVLVDGSVLNAHDGVQTIEVQGDGPIFTAYGRTTDLEAWLARTDYVRATATDGGVDTEAIPVAEGATDDGEPAVLAPVGSDLWLDEFQGDDDLTTELALPEDMSLLIASDGVEPAPTALAISWPVTATTPWAGPLIVGGSILLAVGLVLYLLGLRHARRSRGPRRKGIPTLETEPIDIAEAGAEKGVISSSPQRRQLSNGRRPLIAVPAVAVAALLFAGCDSSSWPQLAASPSPTPSPSIIVPEGQGAPAVTEAQAHDIIAKVSETVAQADAAGDADLAATRLGGPMLDRRKTEYALKAAIPDRAPVAAIPSGTLERMLPQAFDGWPRTFMAVVAQADGVNSTVMTLEQQDPWSEYQLIYSANLAAGATMTLAPSYVGAVAVEPSSPFLVLPPDEVAAAYADVLANGDESAYAQYFDKDSDLLRAQVDADRQARTDEFNQTGAETGTFASSTSVPDIDPISLATVDSGAIVAVNVYENETVTPTTSDAVIKIGDNAVVQALTGESESASGFTTTFSDQIYFFVPAQSSGARIQYLGHTSGILSAQVVTS